MENNYNNITQKQITLDNQQALIDLNKKVAVLDSKIERILFFFNSDADTKSEGFIEKSNRHDAEIKKLNSKYRDLTVASGVVAFFVTAIISIVKWVIER